MDFRSMRSPVTIPAIAAGDSAGDWNGATTSVTTPSLFTDRPKEPRESKTRWKPGTIMARAQKVSAISIRRPAMLGLLAPSFCGDALLGLTVDSMLRAVMFRRRALSRFLAALPRS